MEDGLTSKVVRALAGSSILASTEKRSLQSARMIAPLISSQIGLSRLRKVRLLPESQRLLLAQA
jgi:hypothetical protein